jgi:hypothetical protein
VDSARQFGAEHGLAGAEGIGAGSVRNGQEAVANVISVELPCESQVGDSTRQQTWAIAVLTPQSRPSILADMLRGFGRIRMFKA